jgi:hypothetical protein
MRPASLQDCDARRKYFVARLDPADRTTRPTGVRRAAIFGRVAGRAALCCWTANARRRSLANRQLSDRQWAKIQEHLRLPDHARDDFEKIVARHLKGIAARERERERAPGLTRPNQSPSPPISQIISRRQAWSSPASAASRAYTRTVPGWTYVGPVTPHEARAVIFGRTGARAPFDLQGDRLC